MPRSLMVALACIALLSGCAQGRQDERTGSDDERPSPAAGELGEPETVGGAVGAASCVETYSPETLPRREFAFDGVVTQISGAEETSALVTFSVNRWFKGEARSSVTLESSFPIAAEARSSVEGPEITKGKRYLVSGDGGFMWACGFTRDYSQAEARVWADVLKEE